MNLSKLIFETPNFPKPGVLFRDISPMLRDPQALQQLIVEFSHLFNLQTIDAFVGIESRGFIFASLLAAHHKKGLVLLRKAGKLPPPVMSESYKLEYGEATLEMSPGFGKVIIVDDVLATGGTLEAALLLCEKSGYSVEDLGVVINIKELNNLSIKGKEVKALIHL
jgi:adenine phosphoribosyltransferase